MNKNLSKILALVLVCVMCLGALAGCGSKTTEPQGSEEASAPASGDAVKIGVLVADVSGEEALAFRSYYENYIAKNYSNVTFVYTEQLTDAAAEKSAVTGSNSFLMCASLIM